MAFNFVDFLLYSNSKNIEEASYGTIVTISTMTEFLVNGAQLDPTFSPINTITSITQDGNDLLYTYYGRGIKFDTTITDLDIPVIISGDFGYATVPNDLKLAIYRHIDAVHFSIENHQDNVSKVTNTAGNTTHFRVIRIPPDSSIVYDFYSQRQIVLV